MEASAVYMGYAIKHQAPGAGVSVHSALVRMLTGGSNGFKIHDTRSRVYCGEVPPEAA